MCLNMRFRARPVVGVGHGVVFTLRDQGGGNIPVMRGMPVHVHIVFTDRHVRFAANCQVSMTG